MRALLSAGIAATALSGLAFAKEEVQPAYTVLRQNASIPITTNFDRSYTIQRDGSLIFRVRGHWYRARLTPPCSTDLYGSIRLGFVSRGPWFDRASQVIVDDIAAICAASTRSPIRGPRRRSERANRTGGPPRVIGVWVAVRDPVIASLLACGGQGP